MSVAVPTGEGESVIVGAVVAVAVSDGINVAVSVGIIVWLAVLRLVGSAAKVAGNGAGVEQPAKRMRTLLNPQTHFTAWNMDRYGIDGVGMDYTAFPRRSPSARACSAARYDERTRGADSTQRNPSSSMPIRFQRSKSSGG
jgi:hypothetical protein